MESSNQWVYFQYRKVHGYSVYLRFHAGELNGKFLHLFQELGFSELSVKEVKKVSLQDPQSRILSIQLASSRLQQQITSSESLDLFGPEKLSLQLDTPIYTYRNVGILGMHPRKVLWELAISHDLAQTDHMVGLRVMLVRFLAQALSSQGVLCYWGTIKDDSVIIMKQSQSFGEAVVIDVKKNLLFSNGGESKVNSNFRILRRDNDRGATGVMKREELISFLSVSNCLLSFFGMPISMKQAVVELSSKMSGHFSSNEIPHNL